MNDQTDFINDSEEQAPKNTIRVNYLSIPIELIACPFFSYKEKEILTEIIRVSDKYLDYGGCTLTNKELGIKHRISANKVSALISKSEKLGFIINREDSIVKEKFKNGGSGYFQLRKLSMKIPREWKIMGDLYNEAFIRMNKEVIVLFEKIENKLKEEIEFDRNNIQKIIHQLYKDPLIEKDNRVKPKRINTPNPKGLYPITEKGTLLKRELLKENYLKESISTFSKKIIDLWNDTADKLDLPSVIKLTPSRLNKLKTRIEESPELSELSAWKKIFDKIADSEFLLGDNDRGWKVDFDFIVTNDQNYLKILEGKYSNKKRSKSTKGGAAYQEGKYDDNYETIVMED